MSRTAKTDPAERQSVIEFLERLIREATFQAELVEAFVRASGIVFNAPNQSVSFSEQGEAVNDLLLGLGAALRVCAWERAGLGPMIAYDLPSGAQLLGALGAYVVSGGSEGISGAAINQAVLSRAVFRLSRSIRPDFVIDTSSILHNTVNEFAQFLWENRNNIESPPKEEHDNARNR
jgi:hypothetical protein